MINNIDILGWIDFRKGKLLYCNLNYRNYTFFERFVPNVTSRSRGYVHVTHISIVQKDKAANLYILRQSKWFQEVGGHSESDSAIEIINPEDGSFSHRSYTWRYAEYPNNVLSWEFSWGIY